MNAVGGPEHISGEDLAGLFRGSLYERSIESEAGVANQRIDPPEPRDGLLDQAPAIVELGNVGLQAKMLAAERSIQVFQSIEPPRRQDELCLARATAQPAPSDPCAGSGNDHNHVFQVSAHHAIVGEGGRFVMTPQLTTDT